MSQTMFVHDRNDGGFWAYDVAVGVFLKYLIDAAESYADREDAKWIRGCIHDWRVQAILLSNSGLHLDRDLPIDQLAVIVRLIEDACAALHQKGSISANEMQSWDILDGKGVFARGHDPFPIAPVTELGRAIQALLLGTLPK
jgi:hypothetical protein